MKKEKFKKGDYVTFKEGASSYSYDIQGEKRTVGRIVSLYEDGRMYIKISNNPVFDKRFDYYFPHKGLIKLSKEQAQKIMLETRKWKKENMKTKKLSPKKKVAKK